MKNNIYLLVLLLILIIGCGTILEKHIFSDNGIVASSQIISYTLSEDEIEENLQIRILAELEVLAEREMHFWKAVFPSKKITGIFLDWERDETLKKDVFEIETDEGIIKFIDRGFFGTPSYLYAPWEGLELIIFYHGEMTIDPITSRPQYIIPAKGEIEWTWYQEDIEELKKFYDNDPNIIIKNYIEAIMAVMKEKDMLLKDATVEISPTNNVSVTSIWCWDYTIRDDSIYFDIKGLTSDGVYTDYKVDMYTGKVYTLDEFREKHPSK